MFGKLNTNEEALKESADRQGFSLIDTGVYTNCKIKMAYGVQSKSGAMGVTFKFEILVDEKPREYTQTFWCTNKNGDTFWLDKEGKAHNLAGFNHANHICSLVSGKGLVEIETEERSVMIYDSEAKKEILKTVPVLVSLIDEPVALAIARINTNKQVLDQATGKYVDTSETREINEIEKVLKLVDGNPFTYDEVRTELPEPKWAINWAERNTGEIINRVKDVKGSNTKSSAPKPLGKIA